MTRQIYLSLTTCVRLASLGSYPSISPHLFLPESTHTIHFPIFGSSLEYLIDSPMWCKILFPCMPWYVPSPKQQSPQPRRCSNTDPSRAASYQVTGLRVSWDSSGMYSDIVSLPWVLNLCSHMTLGLFSPLGLWRWTSVVCCPQDWPWLPQLPLSMLLSGYEDDLFTHNQSYIHF